MISADLLSLSCTRTRAVRFTNGHVDSYEVGGLVTFAPALFLYANYIYAKGNDQLDNSHSNQVGLTLNYLVWKRTDVYVNVIYQRASGTGAAASVNDTFETSSGRNQTVLRLGMRTLFEKSSEGTGRRSVVPPVASAGALVLPHDSSRSFLAEVSYVFLSRSAPSQRPLLTISSTNWKISR